MDSNLSHIIVKFRIPCTINVINLLLTMTIQYLFDKWAKENSLLFSIFKFRTLQIAQINFNNVNIFEIQWKRNFRSFFKRTIYIYGGREGGRESLNSRLDQSKAKTNNKKKKKTKNKKHSLSLILVCLCTSQLICCHSLNLA